MFIKGSQSQVLTKNKNQSFFSPRDTQLQVLPFSSVNGGEACVCKVLQFHPFKMSKTTKKDKQQGMMRCCNLITCRDITGYKRPTTTSSRTEDLPDFREEIMK